MHKTAKFACWGWVNRTQCKINQVWEFSGKSRNFSLVLVKMYAFSFLVMFWDFNMIPAFLLKVILRLDEWAILDGRWMENVTKEILYQTWQGFFLWRGLGPPPPVGENLVNPPALVLIFWPEPVPLHRTFVPENFENFNQYLYRFWLLLSLKLP